jgi:hypothetical protein
MDDTPDPLIAILLEDKIDVLRFGEIGVVGVDNRAPYVVLGGISGKRLFCKLGDAFQSLGIRVQVVVDGYNLVATFKKKSQDDV